MVKLLTDGWALVGWSIIALSSGGNVSVRVALISGINSGHLVPETTHSSSALSMLPIGWFGQFVRV